MRYLRAAPELPNWLSRMNIGLPHLFNRAQSGVAGPAAPSALKRYFRLPHVRRGTGHAGRTFAAGRVDLL